MKNDGPASMQRSMTNEISIEFRMGNGRRVLDAIHLGDFSRWPPWIATIPAVNFDFRSWLVSTSLSFPSQSPWENERPVSLGSPVERANFSIPWRWSAIIEPVETSQTQDIKSRLRSPTSDSRFDSKPRMAHYPIVIGVGHRLPPTRGKKSCCE